MAENKNIGKPSEAGLNKYGQRLDEFNEFGQSLEAEAWHFDGATAVTVAPLPAIDRLIRPAQAKNHFMAENAISRKPVEVGVNKYGQRLDEFDEFGQSLEAEAWHFDGAVDVPVVPAPAPGTMIRPAQERKRAATGNSTSINAAHRRAA